MKQPESKKFLTKLFSFLMMLLGFSACDSENLREMYGTPTAEFTVKGKVVRATDKKPLKNIQIVVYPLPEEYWIYYADTLFTNENGEFLLDSYIGNAPDNMRVVYEELKQNVGAIPLQKGEIDVEMKQIKKGKGTWDLGKYEGEVEIEMVEVEEEEDGSKK